MGNLPLLRDRRFKQGLYLLKNPDKYIGTETPIYRSGIEYKFFKFLDNNPNVKRWNSEGIVIPYYDKTRSKWRKYYVDNYVEILEGNVLKKYLIELKPYKETQKPVSKKGKKRTALLTEQAIYDTNCSKWLYAIKFCKEHSLDFLLLGYTEKSGFERVSINL